MPEKILVVDDEVEIADLVELYLRNENYIVALHNGSITAASENDTTVFTVTLPAH